MEILTFEETRIIGALIEKEYTTPDYYPMKLNSLTNACNQKSSRNPVVSFTEDLVESVLIQLRDKQLIAKVTGGDNRVPKYKENFVQFWQLTKQQTAILCIMFLRGAQTVGELRSRSNRIYDFKDLGEVHETLDELINRDDPFIVKLPKDSGREHRYTHLFCGEPIIETETSTSQDSLTKVDELEKEVIELKNELLELRQEFEQFKKAFE